MGSVGQSTQGWLPFQGFKSESGTASTRTQNANELGMGRLSTNDINYVYNVDLWLDVGTWKVCSIAATNTNHPIETYKFNGVTLGTVDRYAGAGATNVYAEITGIVITTAMVATFAMSTGTKNASSAGYAHEWNSIALIRTSGTASTPSGTDTPGYTFQHLPWMGTKSSTNYATRTQSSSELGGGYPQTDTTAQNNLFTIDVWLDVGTYKWAQINDHNTDQGIYNITGVNGTQTVDGYGVLSSNVYTEVTGVTIAAAGTKTVQVSMATKNAASSAYGGRLQSLAWIRTGA